MESYSFHYSCRSKPDESIDPTLKSILEELQKMEVRLGEKIEDMCGGLEHCIHQSEQRVEERFVSLEMSRTELEAGRVDQEKQVDGLNIEVNCVNQFFEQENMVHQHGPGIINSSEPTVLHCGAETQGMS
jgi:hypothetical protein